MKNKYGYSSLLKPVSGLPEWVTEHLLQQIRQITEYEPVTLGSCGYVYIAIYPTQR